MSQRRPDNEVPIRCKLDARITALCGCAPQAHVRKVVPGTETINFREARPALGHLCFV